MKLIADRPALIAGALGGYGTVANDLRAICSTTPRTCRSARQDIEQAKSLLKQAGHANLSLVLPTSEAEPGFNEACTLFAEQAKAAGVKIAVQQTTPATYYTASGGFLTRPFGIDAGAPFQSLTSVYDSWYTATSPYNETHWGQQAGGAAASS